MIGTKINPPNISDETMKEMVKFFMKTSIPRIIAYEKEQKRNKNNKPNTIQSAVNRANDG